MIDKALLTKRVQQLDILIEKKQSDLRHAPPGSIRINPKGSHSYFDYYHNGRRHLKTDDKEDQELAHAVAQKAYDENILRRAEKEKAALLHLIRVYDSGCAEDYYSTLCDARQQLVTPIRLTDAQYAAKWQARQLKSDPLPPEAAPFTTDRGERVRSKSELLIANKLYSRGICYFYEPPIELADHRSGRHYTAHPDFLVLNVHLRKEILWEHMGMADNVDYVNHNLHKIRDYETAGYHVGDKLIVTCETWKIPLDTKHIDQMIRQHLL